MYLELADKRIMHLTHCGDRYQNEKPNFKSKRGTKAHLIWQDTILNFFLILTIFSSEEFKKVMIVDGIV